MFFRSFAFKFETANSSDSSSSYSAESCAAYVDIMIKHILANLFDAHHSNKKTVWSAIEEVNTVVQSRGSLQTKLMFQVPTMDLVRFYIAIFIHILKF